MSFDSRTGLHKMKPLGMDYPGSSFQGDRPQQAGRGDAIASAERLIREYQNLRTEEEKRHWRSSNQNDLSELKNTLSDHYLFNDLEKLS